MGKDTAEPDDAAVLRKPQANPPPPNPSSKGQISSHIPQMNLGSARQLSHLYSMRQAETELMFQPSERKPRGPIAEARPRPACVVDPKIEEHQGLSRWTPPRACGFDPEVISSRSLQHQ